MKKFREVLLFVSRVIFGIVFLFSGFVKAVDPLGTVYKVADYLEAFNLGALGFATETIAVLLILVEFVIGFNLLFNVKLKLTTSLAELFMFVMTPITLYLALENPVSDCGCFGDALVLTNWETFYKNVVLCLILACISFNIKLHRQFFSNWAEWIVMLVPIIVMLSISYYSYNHLPFIDFRPYKVGNNLLKEMEIPEGAPRDEFDLTLFYQKDGVEKAFTLENAPYSDSTWVFARQQMVQTKVGYVPPIHDFLIVDLETNDITDSILYNPDYTLLIVSHKLEKADVQSFDAINKLYNGVKANCSVFWLTSTYKTIINVLKQQYNLQPEFALADDITLKTIVRANPGLVLLKNAEVIAKWHYNDMPTADEINQLINK